LDETIEASRGCVSCTYEQFPPIWMGSDD